MSYQSFRTRRVPGALLAAVLAAAISGCSRGNDDDPPPGPIELPPLSLQRVYAPLTFNSPVAILQAPLNDTRWFVVERGGSVTVFPTGATANADKSTFVSISVNTSGEGGLLGMAFHPDFPRTPQVFLSYTRTGPDPVNFPLTSVISRFTSDDGGATLNPASEEEILTLDQPATNHNGGHIAFDRFGKLFIGFGDGGGGNDPGNHGQNTNTHLGAMLRIDVDGGTPYAIPTDNPFAGGGGAAEIYAWGLRNPWRWSFDRDTGRLWLGDVGQSTWEEIDVVDLGKNYGWRVCEGSYLRGSTTVKCANPAYTDPIAEYLSNPGCRSVTGGYVYRGKAISDLFGAYLFGDFCTGTIWGLKEVPGSAPLVEALFESGLSLVSFGQGVDGELYVVDIGGTLHRVVAGP